MCGSGRPFRSWADAANIALLVASAMGAAGDEYPRREVTSALHRLMSAGIPEAFRAGAAQIGDPLPRHVVHYEDQVRWLIDNIDARPEYADHLKYGYFLRRWPGQWPAAEALRLIEGKLDAGERENLLAFARMDAGSNAQASAVSREWLRLASVTAFARAAQNRPDGWRSAYRRLWANGEALAEHPELFRTVLRDFLGEAADGRNDGAMDRPSAAMIGEFDDWFRRWMMIDQVFAHEPDLSRFVTRFGLEGRARKIIGAVRPARDGSFVFFFRAGGLLRMLPDDDGQTGDGWSLLMAALDAADFTGRAPEFKKRVYSEIAAMFAGDGRWEEAIGVLLRSRAEGLASPVRVAELAHAAWRAAEADRPGKEGNDGARPSPEKMDRRRQIRDDAFADALTEEPLPEDVVGLARLLVALGRRDEAEARLTRLLEDEANTARRDLDWYEAALRLAQLHAEDGRIETADRWLTNWRSATVRPTPRALSLYAESEVLRRRLESRENR